MCVVTVVSYLCVVTVVSRFCVVTVVSYKCGYSKTFINNPSLLQNTMTQKITMNIGLLKQDMKTTICKKHVLTSLKVHMRDHNISGATITDTIGIWEGEQEPSLQVSFILPDTLTRQGVQTSSVDVIKDIAHCIAHQYDQHSVLVEHQDTDAVLCQSDWEETTPYDDTDQDGDQPAQPDPLYKALNVSSVDTDRDGDLTRVVLECSERKANKVANALYLFDVTDVLHSGHDAQTTCILEHRRIQ